MSVSSVGQAARAAAGAAKAAAPFDAATAAAKKAGDADGKKAGEAVAKGADAAAGAAAGAAAAGAAAKTPAGAAAAKDAYDPAGDPGPYANPKPLETPLSDKRAVAPANETTPESETQIQEQMAKAKQTQKDTQDAVRDARADAATMPPGPQRDALLAKANEAEAQQRILDKGMMTAATDYGAQDHDDPTKNRGQVPGYTRVSLEDMSKGPIPVKQKDGSTKWVELDPAKFNNARGTDNGLAQRAGIATNDPRADMHNAALFRNDTDGTYTLTFQQTQFIGGQDPSDIAADRTMHQNLSQHTGQGSKHYANAIETATYVKQQFGEPAGLELAGSSMGGGMATAAALKTGLHADVFNPSWVHNNTVETGRLDMTNYSAEAKRPIADGRPLVSSRVVENDMVNTAMVGGEKAERIAGVANPVVLIGQQTGQIPTGARIHGETEMLTVTDERYKTATGAHGAWVEALNERQTRTLDELAAARRA